MIITNFNNELIKVTTELLPNALSGDYSSLKVTGNINCCTSSGEEVISEKTIDLEEAKWKIDLTTLVELETKLQKLQIQNTNTLSVFDVLLGFPIDLAYVASNCETEDCTLESFSVHFTPLFKDAIDNWFTANGIVSDVSVTFSGNIVIIDDLPSNFVMYNVEYGTSEPYSTMFFSFGEAEGVFVLEEAIYISSKFFNLTELIDGVYKITIKFSATDNSYVQETNCAFIDITVKCSVASVLQEILKESKTDSTEKSSTIIHLLHYGLVNGSNCGCNCEELCKVYSELLTLLNNIDPQITNDCGC